MKKISTTLSILFLVAISVSAQSPPTLRIVTETPGLPSELFYGDVKIKPVRLRPGTNQVITIDDIDFLVQQQYIDFLGRFPDPTGFQNWVNTVTNCPGLGYDPAFPDCDRVHMSSGFIFSYEFQGRGYWLLRAGYVGLNRSITDTSTGRTQRSSLTYAEFIPGLAQIGGSNSPAQEEAAKVVYANAFVQRSDFLALFPNSDSNSTYVNKLETNAGVTLASSFKQSQIDGLNGGTLTRAQVFRNIVERDEVFQKYLIPSFVDMEYKGYVRRDPDPIGYNNWIDTLKANPSDYRHMIFGFIYSNEYRNRF
jgi:Domain of unknown function (DUF4214)